MHLSVRCLVVCYEKRGKNEERKGKHKQNGKREGKKWNK